MTPTQWRPEHVILPSFLRVTGPDPVEVGPVADPDRLEEVHMPPATPLRLGTVAGQVVVEGGEHPAVVEAHVPASELPGRAAVAGHREPVLGV